MIGGIIPWEKYYFYTELSAAALQSPMTAVRTAHTQGAISCRCIVMRLYNNERFAYTLTSAASVQ